MRYRSLIGAIALAGALGMAVDAAQAFDDSKYPDWKGVWRGTGGNKWPQPAPLTEEYRKIYDANLRDQQEGGHGITPTVGCLPPGMPRQMNVYEPMQIVITPEMVHMLIEHVHDSRRIYTDGRTWPKEMEPMFAGYSIGKWIDENGDGKYDVLEVETRGLKSGRTFDGSGIPMHEDAETVVKERIYLDKSDQNVLHDEVTVSDHALTHPWTVNQRYTRDRKGEWTEFVCSEENHYVNIGKETYDVSADGFLKPTRKDQPPPDLKYFKAK